MSARAWYKRYPRDFLEGVIGLSLEEKGAYALILDLIYCHDKGLRDDPHFLAGICGVSARKWNSLRARLMEEGKIHIENGMIRNARAEKEMEDWRQYMDGQRRSGARGGRQTQAIARANSAENMVKTARNSAENSAKPAENWTQTGANSFGKKAENTANANKNNSLGEGSLDLPHEKLKGCFKPARAQESESESEKKESLRDSPKKNNSDGVNDETIQRALERLKQTIFSR